MKFTMSRKFLLAFLLAVCNPSHGFTHPFHKAAAAARGSNSTTDASSEAPPRATVRVGMMEKKNPEELVASLRDKISRLDPGQVLENLQSGTLGERGELYVAGQFALIAGILVGCEPIVSLLGPVLLLGGLAVVALSLIDLGTDSLTPFLPPTAKGSLKTGGVYSVVRHPLYAGLILAAAGFSLVTNSADRLVLTVALYALVNAKADIEEACLREEYPSEYAAYTEEVPGRFLPVGLFSSSTGSES